MKFGKQSWNLQGEHRKTQQTDEGKSLIFHDVVGVDDQNSFFLRARRLGALQPCLRQLDEDVILVKKQTHAQLLSNGCLLISNQWVCLFFFQKGQTHIVHQPVQDLLYQTLPIDQLLLRVDLRLDLLQVPVHHRAFLQLLLFLGCKTAKGEKRLV